MDLLNFYSRFIGEGLIYAILPCSHPLIGPTFPLSDSAGQCPSLKIPLVGCLGRRYVLEDLFRLGIVSYRVLRTYR